MFKLNLKIAWRNLWKNKIYAAINIGGLALGLTAFLLMLLYINHEESYDTWSPDLQNVYQLREFHSFDSPDNKQYWQISNESRNSELLKQNIAEINRITKVENDWGQKYSVVVDHNPAIMVDDIHDADTEFFKVMPYKFVQGDALNALNNLNTIVLKENLALKLFGTDKVLGKIITIVRWEGDKGEVYTVTGVVTEPSKPQSLSFLGITHTGRYDKDDVNPAQHKHCEIYAKLNENASLKKVNTTIEKTYINNLKKTLAISHNNLENYLKAGNEPGCKLIPIKEAHNNPPFTVSWREKVKPIVLISVFLLLISIINFVNLATAQSLQRAKEVGVRKVLGANKSMLIRQFLSEAGLQTICALFLCIIIIELVLPSFNILFKVDLSFWKSPKLLSLTIQLSTLLLIITLLTGFYPAKILANYKPAKVLKGNYANSLKGIVFRNTLVVIQFVISVTFIISIGVMHTQLNFIANKDLGFDKSNVINISANYNKTLAEHIRKVPGVKYVSTTTQVMGNTFANADDIIFEGKKINLNMVTVTMETFPTLGIKPVAGRIFSPDYKQDTINSVVLNQSAAEQLGINVVGKTFKLYGDVFQIIGVVGNYHSDGFDKTVLPTIYKITYLGGMSAVGNLLVRFDTNNEKVLIGNIENEWKRYYPNYPMQYQTLETAFKKIMESDNRFMNMIILFSAISVSLSLLGLFALSTFIAKRRTKEIAVRKILGASNVQIVNLLNKSFLVLVVIANLISWPIAYILIKRWLEGFAYRIEMPIFPFLLATIVSIIIAVLTVSIQARKAAIGDPVNALKYE